MTSPDNPISTRRSPAIQPPSGTRDLYPDDALRRRYITEAWRAASIRHGFDEIDGPTFESCDLYAVKSGEGILGELFQAFSGKSPDEKAQVQATGQAPYALRPEFTPTLARMYAAKAGSLPKPAKWFTAGPFFRAERPQRGRLREFLQWNIDVIGLDVDASASEEDVARAKARADAEVIACAVGLFQSLGLKSADVTVRIADRNVTRAALQSCGVADDRLSEAYAVLDKRGKLPPAEFARACAPIGLDPEALDGALKASEDEVNAALAAREKGEPAPPGSTPALAPLHALVEELACANVARWCCFDFSIVRGLAYYTGMVFEVIVDGERAVAGGGRYDNLIELFGGPPTPAVGFGMGDVVLSLVLKDKGLMPEGKDLLDALDSPRCRASARPDVFVISSGKEGCDQAVQPLLSGFRSAGLHARRTYKATKKIPKLLADAAAQHARFAAIIEAPDALTLKNLDTQEQRGPVTAAAAAAEIGKWANGQTSK